MSTIRIKVSNLGVLQDVLGKLFGRMMLYLWFYRLNVLSLKSLNFLDSLSLLAPSSLLHPDLELLGGNQINEGCNMNKFAVLFVLLRFK